FSAATFGIVHAVRARMIPPIDLSRVRVIRVWNTMNGWNRIGLPLQEFEHMAPALTDARIDAAFSDPADQMPVAAVGRTETLRVEAVSGNYALVFDLQPAAGRWIDDRDDAGDGRPVAVISARVWRDWFAADASAIDRQSIQINGSRFAIVGVAADNFRGVQPALAPPEIWIPEHALHLAYPPMRDARWFPLHSVTAFLKPPARIGDAELQTRLMAALAGGSLARDPRHLHVTAEPAANLNADLDRETLIVLTLAALVLLAACANVSNLVYARACEMRGELAVRQSLGATRAQLAEVLLSEALLVGGAAAIVGSIGAAAVMRGFGALFPMFLVDRVHYTSLALSADWQVFACSIGCGVLAAATIGLVVGIAASREEPAPAMWGGGGAPAATARAGARTALVAVQVTAAMLLVMMTGIVLENSPAELSTRVLYDAAPVTAAGVDLAPYGYNQTNADVFFARLVASAATLPGVERVALASAIPGGVAKEGPTIVPLIAPTRNHILAETRRITASAVAVSPSFFDTVGIRMEKGRAFTQADGDGAPLTAILSRSASDVLFPGRSPLGLLVTYGFQGPRLTVVGVAADSVTGPSDEAPFAQPSNMIFVPWAQHPRLDAILLIRAPAAGALAQPLRNSVRALDDRVGLFDPTPVEESRLAWAAPLKAARVLVVAGAAAALAIALIGIYGMLTYFVSRRTKEFGIRMALGATRRQIARLVFDHTVHVMLVGLLFGVLVATLSSRVLEHTLVQLMPNEIHTWAIVPLLVLVTGTIAGCIPALRASRVDPNVALREL
ncbi:MAG: ABC transporter permease, partial [Vicinamibacterales bacterium]